MPSKNDLLGLKVESKNTLVNLQQPISEASKGAPGRQPKPPQEKQSEVVGLRFTPSEIAKIKQRAGLVPLATFLRDQLIKNTNIL